MLRSAALLWVGTATQGATPTEHPTHSPSQYPTHRDWGEHLTLYTTPIVDPNIPFNWQGTVNLRPLPNDPAQLPNSDRTDFKYPNGVRGTECENDDGTQAWDRCRLKSSPSVPEFITDYSCGNCWKRVFNPDSNSWEKTLCNTGTGNGKWHVRDGSWLWLLDPDRDGSGRITAAATTTDQFAGQQHNPQAQPSEAQAMSINTIKQVMGDAYNGMFCRDYLNKYRSGVLFGTTTQGDHTMREQATTFPYIGTTPGGGKACVRGATAEMIKQADDDARMHWYMFGTSPGKPWKPETPGAWTSAVEDEDYGNAWGYASSYAVKAGKASDQKKLFGTGRDGDVPTSWCRYAMRDMLCHVAFPQVLGDGQDCCQWEEGVNGAPGRCISPGVPCDKLGEGKLRVVDKAACSSIFNTCNRRQPSSDEVSGFLPPEYQNGQAGMMQHDMLDPDWKDKCNSTEQCAYPNNAREWWRNLTAYNFENRPKIFDKTVTMESPAWCDMWEKGFGLARAGTGVGGAGARGFPYHGFSEEGRQYIWNLTGSNIEPWDPAGFSPASRRVVSLISTITAALAAAMMFL